MAFVLLPSAERWVNDSPPSGPYIWISLRNKTMAHKSGNKQCETNHVGVWAQKNPTGLVLLCSLQWRHNGNGCRGVSNHRHLDCLLNRLLRRTSKKIYPRHWPLWGESNGDRWIPLKRVSKAKNVSIWWRHHILVSLVMQPFWMHILITHALWVFFKDIGQYGCDCHCLYRGKEPWRVKGFILSPGCDPKQHTTWSKPCARHSNAINRLQSQIFHLF